MMEIENREADRLRVIINTKGGRGRYYQLGLQLQRVPGTYLQQWHVHVPVRM
jgi:hypothetical protein